MEYLYFGDDLCLFRLCRAPGKMIATRARTPSLARLRPSIARKARNSVSVRAEGGFDVDKFVEGLPAPVEYCYAGAAWGAHHRFG